MIDGVLKHQPKTSYLRGASSPFSNDFRLLSGGQVVEVLFNNCPTGTKEEFLALSRSRTTGKALIVSGAESDA